MSLSDFEIKTVRSNGSVYYEVYCNGVFWGTADTVSEAQHDINNAVRSGLS